MPPFFKTTRSDNCYLHLRPATQPHLRPSDDTDPLETLIIHATVTGDDAKVDPIGEILPAPLIGRLSFLGTWPPNINPSDSPPTPSTPKQQLSTDVDLPQASAL